jgi:hypothetical protein
MWILGPLQLWYLTANLQATALCHIRPSNGVALTFLVFVLYSAAVKV